MSAVPGPPPPPPPPPPKASFDALPAELLLEIVGYLQINDYVKFALAIYNTLQHHGLVPPLTNDIYRRITRPPQVPSRAMPSVNRLPGDGESNERNGPVPLPIELNDQIMDHLEPADRIAWLFSDQGMFSVYFPRLSEETRRQLRAALRNANQAQQKGEKE